eukprot:Nitzschia sp. Nitz4//scaffold45_size130396//113047//115398//NITZ4_003471-RA/size130396-processed-gene-0.230-mRNA-1//-1//CDS//3329552464//9372//frame0
MVRIVRNAKFPRSRSSRPSKFLWIVYVSGFVIVSMMLFVIHTSLHLSTDVSHVRKPVQNSGILGQLQDSKNSIPVAQERKPEPVKPVPVVPKMSAHHDLEDFDIHMHKPAENDKGAQEDQTPITDPPVEKSEHKKPDDEPVNEPEKESTPIVPAYHDIVSKVTQTGPIQFAYVRAMSLDRDHPEFRDQAVSIDSSSAQQAFPESVLTPCISIEGNQRRLDSRCSESGSQLVAYNSKNFSRRWCGQDIPPRTAVQMTQTCQDDTVFIFENSNPPISGEGMSPIVVRSKDDTAGPLETIQDCDISCQVGANTENAQLIVEGQTWSIRRAWKTNMESWLARMDSIPLAYYSYQEHNLRNRPMANFDTAVSKAVYIANANCIAPEVKRNKFVDIVEAVFPVDSFGDCHHNAEVPEGHSIATAEGRIKLMSQYKFVLAFDYSGDKDHISPYIWEAYASGATPVVLGADNLERVLPGGSYVSAGSAIKDDNDNLGKALQQLSESKADWEKYHEWRSIESVHKSIENRYAFTKTDPTCRLCRWAYAKKYGLGFDHAMQKIRETKIPRNMCIASESGLVSSPFEEQWVGRSGEDKVLAWSPSETKTCDNSEVKGSINHDSFKVDRTISYHDGVTDVTIASVVQQDSSKDVVLRMSFPGLRNSDGSHFANSHMTVKGLSNGPIVSSATMQDDTSKVSILANWVTSIASPAEGVVEVVIQTANDDSLDGHLPRKMRVIVEDLAEELDKLTEFNPSSFFKTMTEDFVDPLELFLADS